MQQAKTDLWIYGLLSPGDILELRKEEEKRACRETTLAMETTLQAMRRHLHDEQANPGFGE